MHSGRITETTTPKEHLKNKNNDELELLLTIGSPAREEKEIKQKFGRDLMLLTTFEVIIGLYLIVLGAVGIVSRINLETSPLPPFAIISFFVFMMLLSGYFSLSIIRKGNVSTIILGLIGIFAIIGFQNPFVQAINFYLCYLIHDLGRLNGPFQQVRTYYRSYSETFEVERLYLSFQRLLRNTVKRNILILTLGMMPLIVSAIIEFDVGYYTTVLYPFLFFIALMMIFLTKMGLIRNFLNDMLREKTDT